MDTLRGAQPESKIGRKFGNGTYAQLVTTFSDQCYKFPPSFLDRFRICGTKPRHHTRSRCKGDFHNWKTYPKDRRRSADPAFRHTIHVIRNLPELLMSVSIQCSRSKCTCGVVSHS